MRTAILLLGLAATAQAQLAHTFDIDEAASAFTWSGNTTLGPIVGVPDDKFNLSGTIDFDLWGGSSQPIAQGDYTGGEAILPYIQGEIPGAFFPLATIELIDVRFTSSSAVFSVDPNESFAAVVTLTATQGTLVITPFVGNAITQDLTGLASDPTSITGDMLHSDGDVHHDVHVSFVFAFSDPGTGLSGDLSIDGDIIANYIHPDPETYCVLSPNSAGPGALMSWSGSTSIFQNDLQLYASGVPADQFGIFFYGPSQAQASVGDGTLCVGGNLKRLPVVKSDIFGQVGFPLDLNTLPGGDQLFPGDTRNFAFWYRDNPGGPAGYNFSNGLEAVFSL